MTTSKAIAGAVAALIAALLAKYGISLLPEVSEAVDVLLNAIVALVIGYVGVYIAPKNTEQ
jgi:predicted permease